MTLGTMTRVDADVQQGNVQHVLDKVTAEYWATSKMMQEHAFSNRRAQLEAMKHQARLVDAIDKLTEARNAVAKIVSALPREEEEA